MATGGRSLGTPTLRTASPSNSLRSTSDYKRCNFRLVKVTSACISDSTAAAALAPVLTGESSTSNLRNASNAPSNDNEIMMSTSTEVTNRLSGCSDTMVEIPPLLQAKDVSKTSRIFAFFRRALSTDRLLKRSTNSNAIEKKRNVSLDIEADKDTVTSPPSLSPSTPTKCFQFSRHRKPVSVHLYDSQQIDKPDKEYPQSTSSNASYDLLFVQPKKKSSCNARFMIRYKSRSQRETSHSFSCQDGTTHMPSHLNITKCTSSRHNADTKKGKRSKTASRIRRHWNMQYLQDRTIPLPHMLSPCPTDRVQSTVNPPLSSGNDSGLTQVIAVANSNYPTSDSTAPQSASSSSQVTSVSASTTTNTTSVMHESMINRPTSPLPPLPPFLPADNASNDAVSDGFGVRTWQALVLLARSQNQLQPQTTQSPGGKVVNPSSAHSQVEYQHHLITGLVEVFAMPFYWGVIDRYEAEAILEDKPEGCFLLRDSAQDDFVFSVSFRRFNRTLHARLEQRGHHFTFDSHDPNIFSADTVACLLEHYKDPTNCMFYEPMCCTPVPRSSVFTLQDLCRANIASSCPTYDSIAQLPVPRPLVKYLRYYHYKVPIRCSYFGN